LDIFLTADIEIWCDGWDNIDSKFDPYFKRYIYGDTEKGQFGLPYQLDVLRKYQLKCTFFVEPLFSFRFGLEPLQEIVGLIQEAGQSVQLHLHTEWLDEAKQRLFPNIEEKRQYIKDFDLEQQRTIIALGLERLKQAGAAKISAFRAGSFAFDMNTIKALKANDIFIDCSYNATLFGPESGTDYGVRQHAPFSVHGVKEYPMSIFDDKISGLRHAQLTACSFSEIKNMIKQASKLEFEAFVYLFHNFEFLKTKGNAPDLTVVKRFERLCEFLSNNRSDFPTQIFDSESCSSDSRTTQNIKQVIQPMLVSSKIRTARRISEQMYRKCFG
jgi:hypothetical protein